MVNFMYKIGQKIRDLEYGYTGYIEDKEYLNGWVYLISLPNGAMGYRYENEIELITE